VPAEAIVIPGVRQKAFPAGTYGLPSGLIVGYRGAATDAKIVLNDVLREFGLPADPEG
jgi:2,3,4,5-tetrahydropyridine-2-carboxylate N-succinyltransferase